MPKLSGGGLKDHKAGEKLKTTAVKVTVVTLALKTNTDTDTLYLLGYSKLEEQATHQDHNQTINLTNRR